MKTKTNIFDQTIAKQLLSNFGNDTNNFEGWGSTLVAYKKV